MRIRSCDQLAEIQGFLNVALEQRTIVKRIQKVKSVMRYFLRNRQHQALRRLGAVQQQVFLISIALVSNVLNQ